MCNNCIHKIVCSKYIATGGVKSCEHFKEERRGKWMPHFVINFGIRRQNGYNASCCNGWALVPGAFCSHCGADMRGAENDQ